MRKIIFPVLIILMISSCSNNKDQSQQTTNAIQTSTMITVRIQHRISNYDSWKKAFDSDPINRKQSGVKRYRIYRPADNDKYVIIDLDFDNLKQAESTKAALEKMFPKVVGSLIFGVKVDILNVTEAVEL